MINAHGYENFSHSVYVDCYFCLKYRSFAKPVRNAVCMRSHFTTHKHRIVCVKIFLPVRLIHRFTIPFQLRNLQYSIVLQLAAAERKKGPQASELLAMPI